MVRTAIDPVTRIEGHLRVEMEVKDGVVTDAWSSGGCFRGMELVVENRTPADAAHIVQRICGVCPVSHSHAASIAGEKALGITIPNNARIIRNLIEGAQFLHSHILWLYNLAGLDYVNPLNALTANIGATKEVATAFGTSTNTDFKTLAERLQKFADNGQLSIFSGNWFDADGGKAFKCTPEQDLLLTSHYLEALTYQSKASEIAALLGGKMPHVMTITPGGTPFVPTEEKLDDLLYLVRELRAWVDSTLIPDTLILASVYPEALEFGKGPGRYIAWGVFEGDKWPYADYKEQMKNRYLPSGVLDEKLNLTEPDESKITEYVGRSWYKGKETYTSPYFTTEPEFTKYDTSDRYSWVKRPEYGGKSMEASSLARVLAAYKRGVPFIKENVDAFLEKTGLTIAQCQSTLGRTAVRQIETVYIAKLMEDWTLELIEAVKGGDSKYFVEPTNASGSGTGFWEAPRGALYHSEKVTNGKIDGYQIIIPSTWNLAPRGKDGSLGPLEEALVGCPVETIDKPINCLRTVHSFDPCTACSVHISEPATGKTFKTVTNPWGVK